MKIESTNNNLPPVTTNTDGRGRATARSQDNNTPVSSTNVSLGATSVQLNNMESTAANSPVVNSAKVAEISQAISEGRFQVNAGAVADGLIKSVTDLLGLQQA